MRATAALVVAVISGLTALADDRPSPPAAPVVELVARLGHPDFQAREAASKALEAVGVPALPALTAATGSADAEVARRAAGLVAGITSRADNDRTLAPSLVDLGVKDQPLASVFAAIEMQTGYRFTVADPESLAKSVTVNTGGAVPFWVAVDRVCAAAGLEVVTATYGGRLPDAVTGLESVAGGAAGAGRGVPPTVRVVALPVRESKPGPNGLPRPLDSLGLMRKADALKRKQRDVLALLTRATDPAERKRLEELRDAQTLEIRTLLAAATEEARQEFHGRMGTANGSPVVRTPSGTAQPPDGTVALRSQLAASNPGCVGGAVRVEATAVPAVARSATPADVLPVVLTVIPEPKLKWERVESVRVTKAVDDAGRAVTARTAPPAPAPSAGGPDGVVVVWNAAGVRPAADRWAQLADGPFTPLPTQAVVRLAAGDRPPRRLKEFEGVIRAVVQTEVEEVAAVTGLDRPTVAFGRPGAALRTGKPEPAPEGDGGFTLSVTIGYRPDEVRVADGTAPDQTVMAGVGPNGQVIVRQVMMQRGGEAVIRQQVVGAGVGRRGGYRGPTGPESGQSLFGLRVADAAGTPFELSSPTAVRRIDPTGGLTDEVKLVLRPTEAGQGKPVRVSFHGVRSKTVEVPFRLLDVPVAPGTGPAGEPPAPPLPHGDR